MRRRRQLGNRPVASVAIAARILLVWLAVSLLTAGFGWSQVDYSRPVDVAPSEEAIGEGYVTPEVQRPLPTSIGRQLLDLGLLAGALGLVAW